MIGFDRVCCVYETARDAINEKFNVYLSEDLSMTAPETYSKLFEKYYQVQPGDSQSVVDMASRGDTGNLTIFDQDCADDHYFAPSPPK